ncbi:putative PEX20 peroxisomal biogenesis factor 20 [Cladorrhinum sp. PSN259]|nr:putative PEX20 peroxisomal biogenesis factor 20 [Cladorrhinum sp. PSN259]
MADSMCGPSNGAKNLLAHTDRDRSHHQDRLVQGSQAGPGGSFRSANHAQSSAANADFQHFQGGANPGLNAPLEAPYHMAVTQQMGPRAAPFLGFHVPPITGSSIAAARLDSPATGGMGVHQPQHQAQSWLTQFNSMQLNAVPAVNNAPVSAGPVPLMHNMQPALTSGYQPMVPSMSETWYSAAPSTASFGLTSAVQTTAAAAQETAEVRSTFDDLFGQYDAANQAEFAKQTADFEAEEAKWMDEHGPAADAAREADAAAVQEMERIAQEQEDQKRKMDDDLARAAGDILFAVEGNASAKFQQSNFLNLMRRIARREVVVDEKSFVNAQTGDEVSIVMDEGPKDTVWHGEAVDAIEAAEINGGRYDAAGGGRFDGEN